MVEALHGGMIAHTGVGCLILGPSGSGKSRLMAEMIVLGAKLVADDRVELTEQAGMLMAGPPKELAGVMELRGAGLIRLHDALARHVVHAVIELGEADPERLPEPATITLLEKELPLLKAHKSISAAVLLLYLKAMQEGRMLPPDWRPGA